MNTAPLRLLALLALLPALLPAATVEERLATLESRITALSEENAALKNQLGTTAQGGQPLFVTVTGKEKKLSIGGYVQLQGETGGAPDDRFPVNDRFLVRRARLTLKGSFVEDIDFVFQSEFGNGNLAQNANYRAQLTDLYTIWKKYDFANVTFGQFKTPYGYEQLQPDTKLPFIERSLPGDRMTLSRQIGLMTSGKFYDERLTYATGVFNGNSVNNGGNDNENFMTVGRIAGTPVKTKKLALSLGANAYSSEDGVSAATTRRTGYAFDAQLNSGRFDSAIEWFHTDFDKTGAADTAAAGWAAYTSYFLIPKKIRAAVRYETYDPNTSAADDQFRTWTLGLSYFIKGDDLKLTVNYLLGDPAGRLDNQGRFVAQAQVIF
ncbi:MAG: porin [Opitutaceae bacterium]|jgi:phosphate-selective porin